MSFGHLMPGGHRDEFGDELADRDPHPERERLHPLGRDPGAEREAGVEVAVRLAVPHPAEAAAARGSAAARTRRRAPAGPRRAGGRLVVRAVDLVQDREREALAADLQLRLDQAGVKHQRAPGQPVAAGGLRLEGEALGAQLLHLVPDRHPAHAELRGHRAPRNPARLGRQQFPQDQVSVTYPRPPRMPPGPPIPGPVRRISSMAHVGVLALLEDVAPSALSPRAPSRGPCLPGRSCSPAAGRPGTSRRRRRSSGPGSCRNDEPGWLLKERSTRPVGVVEVRVAEDRGPRLVHDVAWAGA
jgi:hypothetical protein